MRTKMPTVGSSASSMGNSHPSMLDGERRRSLGRQRVVVKMVREVGSAQFPQLTRSNYEDWVVLMTVMLKARGLWSIIKDGTDDEQEDQMAMEAILKAVPVEYHATLGRKKTAKEAWTSLETMRVGSDRVKKAKVQQLR